MSTKTQETPQTAVWYFVGAVFSITLGPQLFDRGQDETWLTILFIALGLVLIVCGGVQLGKEIRLRREAREQQEPSQPLS